MLSFTIKIIINILVISGELTLTFLSIRINYNTLNICLRKNKIRVLLFYGFFADTYGVSLMSPFSSCL